MRDCIALGETKNYNLRWIPRASTNSFGDASDDHRLRSLARTLLEPLLRHSSIPVSSSSRPPLLHSSLLLSSIILIRIFYPMAQEPIYKFNSSSKGFSLGWDVPDVRPLSSSSFYSERKHRDDPIETMSIRGDKFIHRKPSDTTSKVGSDIRVTNPETTPKISRHDRDKSSFYFGDHPPVERVFKKKERTEKEICEDTARYDECKKLKVKAKKDQIEKVHNEGMSRMEEKIKKRPAFRF